jgi:hypothetical protein
VTRKDFIYGHPLAFFVVLIVITGLPVMGLVTWLSTLPSPLHCIPGAHPAIVLEMCADVQPIEEEERFAVEGEANYILTKDKAIEIFSLLVGMGYDVAIKHAQTKFYVEVPVTLRGSKSYGKQAEIMALAIRGGFQAVQTGQTLRIVGK